MVPEDDVYVACLPIFQGFKAELGTLRLIKKKLKENPHRQAALPLVKQYGIDHVSKVVKELLQNGVFRSEELAKQRFPHLFDMSDEDSLEKVASEACITIHEANEKIHDGPVPESRISGVIGKADEQLETTVTDTQPDDPAPKQDLYSTYLSRLQPSYLDYKTQHAILTRAQTVLEEACFNFAQHNFPVVLKEKDWHDSESIELTKWTDIFRENHSKTLIGNTSLPKDSLECSLKALARLRHTAVHRQKEPVGEIKSLLSKAISFLQVIGDLERSDTLRGMSDQLDQAVEELSKSKSLLLTTTEHKMMILSEQIEALKGAQETVIQEMIELDRSNCRLAGEGVRKYLETGSRSMMTQPSSSTENEEDIDPEEDDSVLSRIQEKSQVRWTEWFQESSCLVL